MLLVIERVGALITLQETKNVSNVNTTRSLENNLRTMTADATGTDRQKPWKGI